MPGSLLAVMFEGQVKTGGSISLIVTVKEQVFRFPLLSEIV